MTLKYEVYRTQFNNLLDDIQVMSKYVNNYSGIEFPGFSPSHLWKVADKYIKNPTLTKKERAFCELVESGYLCRDSNGELYYTSKRHKKQGDMWDGEGSVVPIAYNLPMFELAFDFISWNDDEPWLVEDLLKLEVEK